MSDFTTKLNGVVAYDLDDIFQRTYTHASRGTTTQTFRIDIRPGNVHYDINDGDGAYFTYSYGQQYWTGSDRYLKFNDDDDFNVGNYGAAIQAQTTRFSVKDNDLANMFVKKNSMYFCVIRCASEHISIELQGWIRAGVVLKTYIKNRARFIFCNDYHHSSLIIASASDGDNGSNAFFRAGGNGGSAGTTSAYEYTDGHYGGMVINGGEGGYGQWESRIQHYPRPGQGGINTRGGYGGSSGTSSNYGFSSGGHGGAYSGGSGAMARGDGGFHGAGTGQGGEGGDGFYGGGGGGGGGNPNGGQNDGAGAGGGAGSSYYITGSGGTGVHSPPRRDGGGTYLFYDMKLTNGGVTYGINRTNTGYQYSRTSSIFTIRTNFFTDDNIADALENEKITTGSTYTTTETNKDLTIGTTTGWVDQ
jgi:hypothetical protein